MNTFKTIILLLSIFLFTDLISAVKLGMQIPPNPTGDNDLLTNINLLHHEIYGMDDSSNNNLRNDAAFQKKLEKLNAKLQRILTNYLINNSCLRYYLADYINCSQTSVDTKTSESVMLAFNIELPSDHHIDQRIQRLNLNVLDRNANTLRRINNISQQSLRLLVDYPLTEKTTEFCSEQYVDICFENLMHDRSWNSKPSSIEVFLEIQFGVEALSERYKQSTKLIDDIANRLGKVDEELDAIVAQLQRNLKTSEPALRNKNEDTLDKFMRLFILSFLIYILANFGQMLWLYKYLKGHGLL